MKTTICATFLLLFAAFSEGAWARGIYVDVNAAPGGDGTRNAPVQTIAQAMERAREIRRNERSRIVIHVAPGVYNENFPIYVNVSNLALRGSTHLIEDDDDLPGNCGTDSAPVPCVESGTETLIVPPLPQTVGSVLFLVAPTKENAAAKLTDITISGFIFDGKATDVASAGDAIYFDRVDNFSINHTVTRNVRIGIWTRMATGRIQNNFAYNSNDGLAVFGGSELYPATVDVSGNRVTNNSAMGAAAVGTATVKAVKIMDDPNIKEIQTLFDPRSHPEQVPDKLAIVVIGNDFSRNSSFGFRFESYVNGDVFYDTTDNQPMTANIRATVRSNLCRNNGEYGFTVEGASATRINPPKFTGTFDGSFEDNDCSGTGRAGIFAGFMLNGVVTRNPGLINTNKYLQDSRFTAQIDDQSLSSGFDYDNPILDPFDKQTPLNNQLTINGYALTGQHVTCPSGFPCVP